MNLKNFKAQYFQLSVIVVLQLLLIIYIKYRIKDLFIDEYYTFNFSSAYYFPILWDCSIYSNRWLSHSFWHQLITVQADQVYDFASVYYNTAMDVHPPVYYFIEHLFFSFFPDKFSIWIALFPNFLEFILCQYLVFSICNVLWKNKNIAFVVCLIYGFSVGAINTVAFIRMYMLLTLWCLLYFYIILFYIDKFRCKWLIVLFFINIFGFLTHYYFILFSTCAFFALVYLCFKQKKYNYIGLLTFTNILALISSFVIFPDAYVQIFGSSPNSIRGVETISNVFKIFSFNARSVLLLIDTPIAFMAIWYMLDYLLKYMFDKKSINNLRPIYDQYYYFFKYFCVGLLFLTASVFQLCPFLETRYFYFLYPFWSLVCVWFIYIVHRKCRYSVKSFYILISFCLSINFYNVYVSNFSLRYEGNLKIVSVLNSVNANNIEKCVALLNSDDPSSIVYNLGVIKEMSETYITSINNLENYDIELDDRILLFIHSDIGKEQENRALKYFYQKYRLRPVEIYESPNFNIGKNIILSR